MTTTAEETAPTVAGQRRVTILVPVELYNRLWSHRLETRRSMNETLIVSAIEHLDRRAEDQRRRERRRKRRQARAKRRGQSKVKAKGKARPAPKPAEATG